MLTGVRRSPIEVSYRDVRVALAAGADGELQRFCYFLDDGDGGWRPFDIRSLAEAAGVKPPFQHTSSHFADAWLSLTMAAAVFISTWRDRLPELAPQQMELL